MAAPTSICSGHGSSPRRKPENAPTLSQTPYSTPLNNLLIKMGFEPAPLLLGFVLGHLIEENLRRAMLLSRGELSTFAENPLSLVLLVVSAGLLLLSALPALRAKREEVFVED